MQATVNINKCTHGPGIQQGSPKRLHKQGWGPRGTGSPFTVQSQFGVQWEVHDYSVLEPETCGTPLTEEYTIRPLPLGYDCGIPEWAQLVLEGGVCGQGEGWPPSNWPGAVFFVRFVHLPLSFWRGKVPEASCARLEWGGKASPF